MVEKIRYYSAANAYQQGLYRKAQGILAKEGDPQKAKHTERSYQEADLLDKISWWNQPRLGAGGHGLAGDLPLGRSDADYAVQST